MCDRQAATRGALLEKVFLEISQNSQENTGARVSFLINFIKKETQAQLFSCEFCKISRNNFFIEHFRQLLLDRALNTPLNKV